MSTGADTGAGVSTRAWTTPAAARKKLARRWTSGEFLATHARAGRVTPVEVVITGPTPSELAERHDEASRWVLGWRQVGATAGITVQTREAGGRSVGRNTVASRLVIDTDAALWSFLGVTGEVRRFDALLAGVGPGGVDDRIRDWMAERPLTVLDHATDWPAVTATVRWLAGSAGTGRHLREIPIPGVDTKFIDSRRGLLAALLDACGATVDATAPVSRFTRRYGFADKPARVVLRSLDPDRPLLPGITELAVRAGEIEALPLGAHTRVVIVENDTTYLSLPPLAATVAVLGGGYAVTVVARAPGWLRQREVSYWGDLDTHGFAILDRLRALVPGVTSLLMDRATLLAHRSQWVSEPSPVSAALEHLTPAENSLYTDLVEDTFGPAVRLEQERVSFPMVQAALRSGAGG